jgi:hypothetical protein
MTIAIVIVVIAVSTLGYCALVHSARIEEGNRG